MLVRGYEGSLKITLNSISYVQCAVYHGGVD